ncbi:MAG: InlB B-repeat-containing protein [Clostridia bacterium]|nr:InlB B-repeat-containing protein [Clostridia bacterium]
MLRIKNNWLKQALSVLLAVVFLLQLVPTSVIADAIDAAMSRTSDYTPGDVNGDGRIDALDVNLVRRHIAGGYDVKINALAADVNADGYVTAKDVSCIRQYVVGGYGTKLLRGLERFTVKFETGGGTAIADKIVLEGTLISTLPTPYWVEHIFVGWCYDAALKQTVQSTDKVTKSITLYANWLEQAPLDTLDVVTFASAVDVDTDFAITVLSSDPNMTADDVLAVISATDLTDPDAENIITVSGTTGAFTVKGRDGFSEGCSYRITLNSDKLTFKDQPETARDYNFTVHRDEVMNLTMKSDIKYLPLNKVSNIINNGQSVSTLDLALYEAKDNTVTVTDLSTGSFNYTGNSDIKMGDIVCVYDGEIPTKRTKDTPESKLGDMAYLEITEVSGNKYTYESADAEDVIFTPDVLPMPEAADTDTDVNTVTVENKYLDYSADIYSYNNLDSQTTVDVGDFLAFYTGDYGVSTGENAAALTGYGKITKVTANDNDTTTVTFIKVTWEDVESCLDVYTEEEMSAQELLEGMDTEEIESEIEQQAVNSGFAEEAALYLTSLSLATENFTALSENINLEDYKVTLKDGTAVSPEQLKLMAGGGIKVEIEETTVKARVSKNPTHLGDIAGTDADKKGISLSLDVKVVFTISSDSSDGHLEITITGSFVEEIGVDFSASADAVWDWAVIIPYISDIKAAANVDVMNYTAISFNATMVTKKNDDDDEENDKDDNGIEGAVDMAAKIKELLSDAEAEDGDNAEKAVENQNKLVQRYSEMVKAESDWIKLLEKNITEVKKSIPFGIPLINISFSLDFVVQLDASISVGFDFEYIEGKRHVFSISLKAGEVYSDTIELQEKAYEFCFYAMGRIGLKAGVEMEFSIYAISKKLGSVGFNAGAGAYTKLYGYFFYELKYTASKGKSTQYSGALLIQVGIYLELGLEAQALGGRYSAEVNLLDKEWKLYEVGHRDNVLDFNMKQSDVPDIKMKQFVRQIQLSDDFFNMYYLDLITGEDKTAVYNDWNDPEREDDFRNGENFIITMTNDKFTYDPKNNIIAVHPDEDDLKLTGEMIVTWKKKPMSFSSKPITRTLSLYWDNLRDGYMIVPYTNGGSYIPMIVKDYESAVTKPANPEKLGYTFAGWYSDATLKTPYTFPKQMPAADASIYAKWKARNDIPYTVEHYKENFRSGEYELYKTETFKGTTDTYVTPDVKTYTGYVAPAKAELKVEADGSAVLRYYYNLERHNITFDAGKVDGEDVTAETDVTYNLKYGASISAPQMAMKGYSFVGWTVDGTTKVNVAETVGTKDLTYTAMWQKDNDTPYRIEYYVEQTDGRYTLQNMIEGETVTGRVFTDDYLRSLAVEGATTADQKFLLEDAIVFENMTVKGIVCDEAEVDGSGKTVIKINYGRKKHTLTFDLNYKGSTPIVKELYYESEIIAPQNVTRTGYTFVGWEITPAHLMPANSLTYKAVWKANDNTAYKVEHYKEQLDGSYILADTDNLKGTTGSDVTPNVKSYTGFKAPSTQTVTVKADGSLVVKYNYTRNSYTVTFDANGGTVTPTSITAKYGESINLPAPTREGYGFSGWYNGSSVFSDAAMGAENLTVKAKWTAGQYGYTVNHYQQNVDGNGYSLAKTENGTADMDSDVTPNHKSYEGFTAPAATTTITIKVNAQDNVVDYYYTRNQYTLTWELGIGSADGQSYTQGKVYYGAAVTAPIPVKRGYTFKWSKTPVTVMPASDLTYIADWTENSYKVIFHANNGTATEDTVELKFTDALGDNTFSYDGYIFTGWSDGVDTYNAADKLSRLVTDGVDTYHLYAVWQKQRYSITYVGVEADEHDNATEYTVEDTVALSVPDERTGYTFIGWYDNAAFEGNAVQGIAAGSIGHKLFYALWEENTYTVVLNVNDGTGTFVTTEPILYTGYLPENTFERVGYSFLGWATATDGTNTYNDSAAIADIAGNANGANQVTLFAIWKLNEYSITYSDWNVGSAANPNTVTVYTVASESDVVLASPTAKAGYKFLGWYEGETKITAIAKTAGKDYSLVAKWAHAGTFTISYTSTTNRVSTYTIKRTLPAKTVVTAEPQVVYVRTQNGTAYGVTPEVATASQQDKYHFIHVNPTKEGSGIATFTASDFSKTVTVTEKDDNNADNPLSSYQIGGKARYYRVELYKVVDSTGNCNGVLGSTKSVKRTMPVSSYQVPTGLYTWYSHRVINDPITITDSGYGKNDWRDIYPKTIMNMYLTDAQEKYRDLTATDYAFRVTFDVKEVDKGYQWVKFTDATNRGGSTLAEYRFESAGTSKADWGKILSLPRYNTNTYNGYVFNDKDEDMVSNKWTVKDTSSSTPYALIALNKNMSICFDAAGDGDDDWKYKNLDVHLRVYDYNEPKARNVSPLALTSYAKDEAVVLTVIYNEPINSISGTPSLTLSSKLKQYFRNPSYIDNGTGTNTISFTCYATKDLTADDIMKINEYLVYNESSVGGSFASNIGTLSAYVYDICSD